MQGVGRPGTLCLQALKGWGCDVLLVPRRIKEEVDALMEAIDNGELTQTEVDDHCRRVLTWKYALGLSRKPRVQLSGLDERISPARRAATGRHPAPGRRHRAGQPGRPAAAGSRSQPVAVVIVGQHRAGRTVRKRAETLCPGCPPHAARRSRRCRLPQTGRARLKGYRRVVVCVTTRKPGRWWTTFFEQWQPEVPAATVFFTPAADVNRLPGSHPAGRCRGAGPLDRLDDVQRHTARVLYGHATADGRLPAAIGDLFRAGTGVTIRANVRPVAPSRGTRHSPPLARQHCLHCPRGAGGRRLPRMSDCGSEGRTGNLQPDLRPDHDNPQHRLPLLPARHNAQAAPPCGQPTFTTWPRLPRPRPPCWP